MPADMCARPLLAAGRHSAVGVRNLRRHAPDEEPQPEAELGDEAERPRRVADRGVPRGEQCPQESHEHCETAAHVTHRDGSFSPLEDKLDALVLELDIVADDEHPDIAVSHESDWSIIAFPSGRVVLKKRRARRRTGQTAAHGGGTSQSTAGSVRAGRHRRAQPASSTRLTAGLWHFDQT